MKMCASALVANLRGFPKLSPPLCRQFGCELFSPVSFTCNAWTAQRLLQSTDSRSACFSDRPLQLSLLLLPATWRASDCTERADALVRRDRIRLRHLCRTRD